MVSQEVRELMAYLLGEGYTLSVDVDGVELFTPTLGDVLDGIESVDMVIVLVHSDNELLGHILVSQFNCGIEQVCDYSIGVASIIEDKMDELSDMIITLDFSSE